eukprot:6207737-Ditylum_brightwellii.AAC.1
MAMNGWKSKQTIMVEMICHQYTPKSNHNLTYVQRELMRWHQCLGHISFKQIQWLARTERAYSSRGSYHPRAMHNGGSIFANHTSGTIFAFHDESLSVSDSIESILEMERYAAEIRVKIQALYTGNGTFSSNVVMSHLANQK